MFPEEINSKTQRAAFELRAAGVRKEQLSPLRSGIHTRGYLPHVKREGARYFVTFRLADSLPKEALLKILQAKARRVACASANLETMPPTSTDVRQTERDYFRQMEDYLDKGSGECWLRHAEIAEIVSKALIFFDGERYQLKAWVVMPTHVHVVLWPMPNQSLSAILQSWKGYSARAANKILGRLGQPFWQTESYDHWIRDDVEHDQCCRYVIYNPVKARLSKTPGEWPWSSAWIGHAK